MIERGQDLRLAREPCAALGVRRERGGQDLDRDVALQLRIARAIDFAHSACAKGREDFIWSEAGAGREGHLSPRANSRSDTSTRSQLYPSVVQSALTRTSSMRIVVAGSEGTKRCQTVRRPVARTTRSTRTWMTSSGWVTNNSSLAFHPAIASPG